MCPPPPLMPEVLIHSMLGPTYPYMVRHFLPGEERIGYYAGLLQSAYFLPTIVCAPVMGFLSDKYGRKPVLLAGLAGYGFGTLLLGLSPTYWLSVLSLFLTGCFAGNTIVAKGMIGELTHTDAARALAYSGYGIVYGVCGAAGAVMGGFLADPERWAHTPVLARLPYLVSCGVGSGTALVSGLVVYFSLETRSTGAGREEKEEGAGRGYDAVALLDVEEDAFPVLAARGRRRGSDVGDVSDALEMTLRGDASPGLKRGGARQNRAGEEEGWEGSEAGDVSDTESIATLGKKDDCLFALSNAIFFTALSLIAAAPVARGGYNLSQGVAFWSMAGYAVVKIVIKTVYYKVNAALGTRWTYRVGVGVMLPAILLIPARLGLDWVAYERSLTEVAAAGVGARESLWARSFATVSSNVANVGYAVPITALVALTSVMGAGDGLTYLSVVMLITDSVPETQYGLVHGLGGCLASIVRTVGPIFGGIVWEEGGANWVVFVCIAFIVMGELGVSFIES
ncbi:major facilitator superfamily domain-containing protein [Chytriomyces sp. MP71]|nr:major facilitator superfamily domain-containing protein [Chytriomyces sp. MP71]